MKSYDNLDRKIKFFTQSRIPDFLGGDFETLFRSELRNYVGDMQYVNILQEGRDIGRGEGTEIGVENGIKNYMIGGNNQIYVSHITGEVYAFSNMNELYKSEKTVPEMTNFIMDHEKINNELLQVEFKDLMKKADESLWESNLENEIDVHEIELTPKKLKKKYNALDNDIKEMKKNLPRKKSSQYNGMLEKISESEKVLTHLKQALDSKNQVNFSNKIIAGEVDPITLASRFSRKNLKPGDVAIFKTNLFSIYNVPLIQKYLSKDRSGLVDIKHSSATNYNKLIDSKYLHDLRTNAPQYEKTIDYIDFPALKKYLLFDKKINDRFNGNVPEHIRLLLNKNGI